MDRRRFVKAARFSAEWTRGTAGGRRVWKPGAAGAGCSGDAGGDVTFPPLPKAVASPSRDPRPQRYKPGGFFSSFTALGVSFSHTRVLAGLS